MALDSFNKIVSGELTEILADDLIGVTYIGRNAFAYKSKLTSIELPSSVTRIDENAFFTCNISSITIPNSVTSIGENAFNTCGLLSVEIPDSVTSIGKSAFSMCSSLTSVILPNSISSLEDSTFNQCKSLTSITIPSSVNTIGKTCFANGGGATAITDAYFLQPLGMEIILPTAGSSSGMFYVKTASSINIHTDNETIKNYAWATDNITPTFYHLDGTLWE